jgi:methylenetetrahydrofolate dehydrogenase (NADP+) / methenyltetrahydrofolate cyclohydrolase
MATRRDSPAPASDATASSMSGSTIDYRLSTINSSVYFTHPFQYAASVAQIIDGKAVANSVRGDVQREVAAFVAEAGRAPCLATVLVGDNSASATYVRSKRKACGEVGIVSDAHELPASTSQSEVLRLVQSLNERRDVHGILVQLPLPPQIDAQLVIEAIDPAKDVDGLHPLSQARLLMGRDGLRPCTPLGVMHLIDGTGIELRGARAVVAGRSALVGKPVALMLLERHATLTICHSRTRDLADEVHRADVLVAAIGRPEAIRGEWIRPGSVVIDVGINRVDGRLVGDVEFARAREHAAAITPVPGGVGPMTVAMLMRNTLTAARMQRAAQNR